MPASFRLEVVSPNRLILQDQVEMIIARTVQGDIGVMARHIPMVAALDTGILRIKKEDKFVQLAVAGGFMEVSDKKVTILATAAEHAEEIDKLRAQEAKRRAEQRLGNKNSEIDIVRAERALRRAMVRLRVAGVDSGELISPNRPNE